jgi:hypothetical protein
MFLQWNIKKNSIYVLVFMSKKFIENEILSGDTFWFNLSHFHQKYFWFFLLYLNYDKLFNYFSYTIFSRKKKWFAS